MTTTIDVHLNEYGELIVTMDGPGTSGPIDVILEEGLGDTAYVLVNGHEIELHQ